MTGRLRFQHGMVAVPSWVWLCILLASAQRELVLYGDQPRRAIEAADLVVDSIVATNTKEMCRAKEWRVKARGGVWGCDESRGP
jgi:hypothetical protein